MRSNKRYLYGNIEGNTKIFGFFFHFLLNLYNKIMVLYFICIIYIFNITMIFVQYDLSIERIASSRLLPLFFSILIQKFYNSFVNP